MDVGISFEENVTVARFYWLLNFKSPTSRSSISASSDQTRHYFLMSSHVLQHQRRLQLGSLLIQSQTEGL